MGNQYQNGVGGSTGSTLATLSPLLHTGTIWYVSSASGDASNSGKDRNQALTTLSAAVAASSNDDIIVLLEDHDETISTGVIVNRRLAIIGEGVDDGKPKVKLRKSSANMIAMAASFCIIDNVRFVPATANASDNFIDSGTVDNTIISNCYFELNEYSRGYGVEILSGGSEWVFRNCTFVSTAPAGGVPPFPALFVDGGFNVFIEECTFDGGSVGFKDGSGNLYAVDATANPISGLRVRNLTLLNGADFANNASTTGWFVGTMASGSARISGL